MEVHRTPEKKAKVIEAGVAAHFATDTSILNVIRKPEKDSYDIQTDMMEGIAAAGGDPYRDQYVTWGLHTGVNDFLDFKHEFIGGLFRKPKHYYKALHSLAAKLKPWEKHNAETLTAIELSEMAHELLQAAGRIAIRQNMNGGCPECDSWVLSPSGGNTPFGPVDFERTFKDCRVVEWNPIAPTLRRGGKNKTDNRAKFFDALIATQGRWFRVGDRYAKDRAFLEFLRRHVRHAVLDCAHARVSIEALAARPYRPLNLLDDLWRRVGVAARQ